MKLRLRHREKQLSAMTGGPCTLCYGMPSAVLVQEMEEDPDGPGLRPVGELRLDEQSVDRVTRDLRCCRCGKAVTSTTLLTPLAGTA